MKDEHKSKKTKHAAHAKHQPKVFDISRPGKAPASPTSRPWVSPDNPVADDQFVPGAPSLRASDPFAKHDLLDPKKRKDLLPLNGGEGTDAAAADPAAATIASAPVLEASPKNTAPTPGVTDISTVDDALEALSTSTLEAPQADSQATVDTAPTVSSPEPAVEPVASQPAEAAKTTGEASTPQTTPQSEPEEDTPAHIALEQTVATENTLPIWEHPATSEQVESSRPVATSNAGKKSIEDLLAETGAPILEPEKEPSMIISHHPRKQTTWWHSVLIFVIIIAIAAVVFDVLIDMNIIRTTLSVPHTNFFN